MLNLYVDHDVAVTSMNTASHLVNLNIAVSYTRAVSLVHLLLEDSIVVLHGGSTDISLLDLNYNSCEIVELQDLFGGGKTLKKAAKQY